MFKHLRQMISKAKSIALDTSKEKSDACPDVWGDLHRLKCAAFDQHLANVWARHAVEHVQVSTRFTHISKMNELKQKLYRMIGWYPEPVKATVRLGSTVPYQPETPYPFKIWHCSPRCSKCNRPSHALYAGQHYDWLCFDCSDETDFVIWGMYG